MRLTGLGAAAVAALVLAGCAGGGSEGSDGGEATLRYAYWGPNQTPAMERIAREFETKNPGIKVQLELTPFKQYWTKLKTSAEGQDLPDVFWINATNYPLYASNDQLLSLKDFAKDAGLPEDKYSKPAVDIYKWKGEQFAFPKDFDTVGLWYNKALFDKAGVEYPTADWTWEDVQAAAKKLTGNGVYGIAAKLDPQAWYYNVVKQGGGEVISGDRTKSGYDSPGAIAALQWSADLINKHKVSPTLAQMSETDPRQMFQSGKVAMIYDGSFAAVELYKNPYTRKNADVTELPAGPAGDVSVIHGVGQAISAATEHEEAAKKFVAFLVGPEGAKIQGEMGTTLPALPEGQDLWLKSMPEFNLKAFTDTIPRTYSYPTSQNAPAWQSIETELLREIWSGERTAQEVAPELAEKMNKALSEETK
jgi:multiple sugar transport system substrate-binding protein